MSVVNRVRAALETSGHSDERVERDERRRPPAADAMAVEHLATAMGFAH